MRVITACVRGITQTMTGVSQRSVTIIIPWLQTFLQGSVLWIWCSVLFGKTEHFICFDDKFGHNVREVPNNGPKEGVQDLKYDLFRTKTPLLGPFGEIWRNLDFNLD